jgi:hypothetical protein
MKISGLFRCRVIILTITGVCNARHPISVGGVGGGHATSVVQEETGGAKLGLMTPITMSFML